MREYVALHSISSLPFRGLILSASEKPDNDEGRSWNVPRPLMDNLKNNLNQSQVEAIHVSPFHKLPIYKGNPAMEMYFCISVHAWF